MDNKKTREYQENGSLQRMNEDIDNENKQHQQEDWQKNPDGDDSSGSNNSRQMSY